MEQVLEKIKQIKNYEQFKLIIALSITLIVISCNKDEDNKLNSAPNNNTSINQYVAFWKLAKYQYKSGGICNQLQTNYSPVTCILNLKNSNSLTPGYYSCDFLYNNCSPLSVGWKISTPGYLEIQLQQYYVQKITSDSLVIIKRDSTAQWGLYEVYRYYK